MKRSLLVILAALGGFGAGLAYRALRDRPMPPPGRRNVLLIVLDTVRADRLGCYGSPLGITPELDRFARSAVRFEQAFSHAPWTLPSVASLLTSRCPVQHGAGGRLGSFRHLTDEAVTIAEVFQRAGAATAAVTNVLYLTELFGTTQGFDTVDADAPQSNLQVRRAGPTTDAALRWIDQRPDKPFFLLVHYFDPHLIYDPPQPFRRRFADPQDTDSPDYLFGTRPQMLALRQGKLQLSPAEIARLEKLHNGEVAYVDSEVGRLLRGLADRGLEANTIVAITADHGEEFLDHGGFEHGHTHYDELLRVPLLIRAPELNPPEPRAPTGAAPPGQGPAARVDATVRQIDLAPTLCELAGITPDPAFAGESLVPLLQGRPGADRPVLSQGNFWGPTRIAWRDEGMKLVRNSATREIQLFDLTADPHEQRDIAGHAAAQRDRMEHDLDLTLWALANEASTGRPLTLTPEQLELLASLGYIKATGNDAANDNSADNQSPDD